MQNEKTALGEATPERLASPAVIKTQHMHMQRGAAPGPPSDLQPDSSPASGQPAVSPSSALTSKSVRQSEIHPQAQQLSPDNTVKHNFVRIQANKIPNSVDLLEAYVHEPNKLQNLPPTQPQKDPLIRLYGLSMFVDNYSPATEARDEINTFAKADTILADLQRILQNDLLRGDGIGSTRQIGNAPQKRSTLAVCRLLQRLPCRPGQASAFIYNHVMAADTGCSDFPARRCRRSTQAKQRPRVRQSL